MLWHASAYFFSVLIRFFRLIRVDTRCLLHIHVAPTKKSRGGGLHKKKSIPPPPIRAPPLPPAEAASAARRLRSSSSCAAFFDARRASVRSSAPDDPRPPPAPPPPWRCNPTPPPLSLSRTLSRSLPPPALCTCSPLTMWTLPICACWPRITCSIMCSIIRFMGMDMPCPAPIQPPRIMSSCSLPPPTPIAPSPRLSDALGLLASTGGKTSAAQTSLHLCVERKLLMPLRPRLPSP